MCFWFVLVGQMQFYFFFLSLYSFSFTKRMTHSHVWFIQTRQHIYSFICKSLKRCYTMISLKNTGQLIFFCNIHFQSFFSPPSVYALLHPFLIKCNGWVAHVQRPGRNSICLKGRGSVKVLVICSYKGWCLPHTWFEKRECSLKGFTISHILDARWL